MEILEKDLEEIIFESNTSELTERGFEVHGKAKRQLRIGNYGVADLIYFNRAYHLQESFSSHRIVPFLHITIVELKKDKVGIGAFLQAIRYARGIQCYMQKYHPRLNFKIHIKLAGKRIDTDGSFIFLPDLFYADGFPDGTISSVDFYTIKYALDGLQFEMNSDYSMIDSGFKKTKRDGRR